MLLPIKTPRCISLVQASPLILSFLFLILCSTSSCECSIQDWTWDFLLSKSPILSVFPNSLEAQPSTRFQIRNLEVLLESSLPLPLLLSPPSPVNLLALSVLLVGFSWVAHFGLLLLALLFLAISCLYHSYSFLTCLCIPSSSLQPILHTEAFFSKCKSYQALKSFQGCPVAGPSLPSPQAASQPLSTLPLLIPLLVISNLPFYLSLTHLFTEKPFPEFPGFCSKILCIRNPFPLNAYLRFQVYIHYGGVLINARRA